MCKTEKLEKLLNKCNPFIVKCLKVEIAIGTITQFYMLAVFLFVMFRSAVFSDFKENMVENTCTFAMLYILMSVVRGFTKYLKEFKERLEKNW